MEDDVKIPIHALSTDPDEAYTLFMGSNNWYLFLRLHHILCERLTKMYDRAVALAVEESKYKQQQRKESTAIALRLKPKSEVEIEDYYPTFLDMVKNVLDGNLDSVTFEDTLREMFGIHAYIAFTLDKVVTYAVRQLQHLVSDAICQQCTELFQREQRQPKDNSGAGGLCTTAYLRVGAEMAYQRRAEKIMPEENCFKVYIYKKECKMTIELLDTEGEETNGGSSERERDEVYAAEKWSTYVEGYSTPSTQTSPKDISTSPNNETTSTNHPMVGNGWNTLPRNLPNQKPLFLLRNIKQWKKNAAKNSTSTSTNIDNNTGHVEENNQVENIIKRSGVLRMNEPDELRNVVSSDDTQCTFDLTNYRVAFVGSSRSWFYRPNCLSRAKKAHLSTTLSSDAKFHRRHEIWTTKNVSIAQQRLCHDWLMGHYDNVIPNRTQILNDNDHTRTPYRSYNKYRVEIIKTDIESGKHST